MGAHGKACTAIVSYPTVNSEPTKDPTYRKIAGQWDMMSTPIEAMS